MASSITRAVLDFAKHVLGHDITPRNNTTKAVLDAFVDDVAGHDVDTRGMGVPEIIDTITANYDGGGASFGDTPFRFFFTASVPTVGSEISQSEFCGLSAALIGGKMAVATDGLDRYGAAAAGVVILTNTYGFTSCRAYKVVVDQDETYTSVTEVEGIVERVDMQHDEGCYYLITMPELQGAMTEDGWWDGEELHIYATTT